MTAITIRGSSRSFRSFSFTAYAIKTTAGPTEYQAGPLKEVITKAARITETAENTPTLMISDIEVIISNETQDQRPLARARVAAGWVWKSSKARTRGGQRFAYVLGVAEPGAFGERVEGAVSGLLFSVGRVLARSPGPLWGALDAEQTG